jgi:hypothetical protein
MTLIVNVGKVTIVRFTEENIKNFKITKTGNYKKGSNTYFYHYACIECGYPHINEKKNAKYCNHECMSISKEWREKNSKFRTGRKTDRISGINNPNWKDGVTVNNIPLYDTFVHQLEPIEQCVRDPEDPNILNVFCTKCDMQYRPTRWDVYSRIKGIRGNDLGKFYCSVDCKQTCSIYKRIKVHQLPGCTIGELVKHGKNKYVNVKSDAIFQFRI